MLSKKSEQFIVELRFYLLSKGKKDDEINEITEELEVHLIEAEKEGKDVTKIIGNSPKQYMKSIGETMDTDYGELVSLIPVVLLLMAAYFSIGPAIEGKFSLSLGIILVAFIAGIIGMFIFGFLLFKILPKFLDSKWSYILTIMTTFIVTGLGVVVLFWYKKQEMEPFYVATPMQNNYILLVCILIIIASSLYLKSWITALVPFFTSIGPIANRWIPEEINKNPTYIFYTVLIIIFVAMILLFTFFRKRKKQLQDDLS